MDRFERYGVYTDEISSNVPRAARPELIEPNRESIKFYLEKAHQYSMAYMTRPDGAVS